jgi:Fe-S oxidoreductase
MAGVKLVDAITKGKELLLEEGINPHKGQQNALESLQLRGNPYGRQPSKRLDWSKGLNLNIIQKGQNNISSLYYVGCTPSYDERVQNVSRSIVKILTFIGKVFGILQNEKCSGDPARVMGERPLFEMLAQQNTKMIENAGIKQIITTSPHDLHCFKNEYPEEIKALEIMHYSELFSKLIDENIITFKHQFKHPVVFHDPCYLGRYHKVYDAPRNILNAIPGLKLLEMKNNRENSLCCGGGGGRMWIDIDETTRTSETRVKEALESGAQVIATACPFCLIHLEDAVKVMNMEKEIRVMDISEIMQETL